MSSLKAMVQAVCNKNNFLSLAMFAVVSEDVSGGICLGGGALLLIALSQID